MKLTLPHFANTLLFRISATFLLLMSVSLGGYYLWIEHTVFNAFNSDSEEQWFTELSESELDSLAVHITESGPGPEANQALEDYGRTIAAFDVEVVAFDSNGRYLWSTAPDSLAQALPQVNVGLLAQMSQADWDFGSYPDSTDASAYINRIFDVNPLGATGERPPTGYLAASYYPVSVTSTDLNADSRLIDAQQNIVKVLLGLLIYAAVTALLIMAWTGRRVQRLSAGVDAFAAGDLSRRVRTRSTDEIGTLGRNFNAMAEHIESMVEKLRQKEQFRRQLIANVSHDLRTPMASMRGYVETLQMNRDRIPAADQDRYLKIIAGNLAHLDRLVDHMLVLSRFDSGQATFQYEDFSVAELADDLVLRFEGIAAEQEVSLNLSVDDEVGLVHADPLQIAQVLQNLIENAIKFNRPGGDVTVSLRRDEQRVGVTVRDTGHGIAPADLPRIFERFFTADESRSRGDTETRALGTNPHLGQSSGLGLSIAAKIVAGHNSILRVESELGQGTTFSFHLDEAQPDDQELRADV